MRVSSRRGRHVLHLEGVEALLVRSMLDDLVAVLDDDADEHDPVTDRLFPSAYPEDVAAEREYRAITLDALREERRDRVVACARTLGDGDEDAVEVDFSDPDVGQRWIQVLNDLRLALGTRLGISEDDPELDPTDPAEQPRVVYYWLTGVQDAMVTALMG